MTTSSSTTTRERLVVTMNDPTNASTRASFEGVGARAQPEYDSSSWFETVFAIAPARRGIVAFAWPWACVAARTTHAHGHATGEPGIVRDRVSIGLHHDGIFTRVSPGASGGAVLGLSNGVWEF